MSSSSLVAELNGSLSQVSSPALSTCKSPFDHSEMYVPNCNASKSSDTIAIPDRTRIRCPTSPLTPAGASRRSERDQLCVLNDRLAQYIEKVRQLELENQKLTLQLSQSKSVSNLEALRVQNAYGSEISEAKTLLGEMEQENEALKSSVEKNKLQCTELEKKVTHLTSSLSESICKRRRGEEDMHNLTSKIEITQYSVKDLKAEYEVLYEESKRYKAETDKFKRLQEQERRDAESRQTALAEAWEEVKSTKSNFLQEIEVSPTQDNTELILEEVGKQLEFVYTNKLHEALHQMRQELDNTIIKNRAEVGQLYELKIKNFNDTAEQNYQLELDCKRESQTLTQQLHDLQSSISSCERKLSEAEQQIQLLSSKLESVKKEHANVRDETVLKLKNELAKMLQSYEDLMGTKVQLTSEIDRYRKMIDVEEQRLCLSPLAEQNGTATKRIIKRAKRLDTTVTSTPTFVYAFNNVSNCGVSIIEIDRLGAYVKLANKSEEDVSIPNWILKCATSSGEDVSYKFHNKQTIKAGKTCTIYSSDSSVTHDFPEVLVMKHQKWPETKEKCRLVLYNSGDEEQAWAELNRIEVFESNQSEPIYQNGDGIHGEDRAKSQQCNLM